MTQHRTSIHDYPRNEALAAMRRMLDFLETTPEVDLPESMGDLLIRTLARQNRGELKEKPAVAQWFRQQVLWLRRANRTLGRRQRGLPQNHRD